MAGEESGNAGLPLSAATLVPQVPANAAVAVPPAPPRYLPYEATSRWRPGPALGVVLVVCALTVAIALGGTLLLVSRSTDLPAIDGRTLIPMLLAQVAMVFGALIAARAKGDRLAPALALKAPSGGYSAYAGWLVLLLACVGLFTAFSAYVLKHDQAADLKGMSELFRGPWWPLALFVIGVGAPLSEELLFRGFLQTALVPTRLGYWGASVITTAIWTAMHAGYSLVGLTEVFLIGLIFCLMLRRTGSLRVTIACHAIYNTLIALVVIFAPRSWLGF